MPDNSRRPGNASARKRSKYQPRSTSSTTTYILAAVAVVVIAVVVVGGVIWNSSRDDSPPDQAVLTQNASLIIGRADAPHTIDVFEDFSCPVCKQFEEQSGETVVNAANNGKLRVRYHVLNFLDSRSGSGDYSSRAAGAATCVAEAGSTQRFLAYHTALFVNQPAEGGASPDNGALAATAASVGVNDATQQCIRSGQRVDAAKASAKESETQLGKATGGQVGTPTVLSEGKPVEGILDGPGWVNTLISDRSEG